MIDLLLPYELGISIVTQVPRVALVLDSLFHLKQLRLTLTPEANGYQIAYAKSV